MGPTVSDHLSEATVVVIDDNHLNEDWDTWFDRDYAQRAEPRTHDRRFSRYGDVCPTPQAARARLLSALQEDLLPDVVVVDHLLKVAGGVEVRRETAGLGLMRWFRDQCAEYGRDLPPCVLWTGEYDEGLGYAFTQSQGAHAFSRTAVPAQEFLVELWNVLDGARWGPGTSRAPLALSASEVALLPYLEAGWPVHEICPALSADLGRPVDADNVHGYVRGIRRKVEALHEHEHGEPTQAYRGHAIGGRLAAFARDHGVLWIPLAYRE